MKKLVFSLVLILTALMLQGQSYVSWNLGANYELNPTWAAQSGIQLKSTATFGYGQGVSYSTQTISSGQEIDIQAEYDASQYLVVALHPTVPTAVVGNSAVKFGFSFGNNGSGAGCQVYESGAFVAGTFNLVPAYFGWFRMIYSGSQIKYSKSADGITWTDFYTSSNVPSGTYKVIFEGATPGGNTRACIVKGTPSGSNQPPVVTVGSTNPIILSSPASSTSVTGTATDPDGTISSTSWSYVSGPVSGTITPSNTLSTTISGLTSTGNYVYRLSATDNSGATSSADLTITVQNPSNFSFTPLSTAKPELRRFMAGAHKWQSQAWDNVTSPSIAASNAANNVMFDIYGRTPWTYITNTSSGTYDWTWFDSYFTQGISNNQKVGFRITTMGEGGTSVGGASLEYPQWLHTQMQSETNKDWIYSGEWIPNWNSSYYLAAIDTLCAQVKRHLDNTVINGVRLRDATAWIDISGYGNFGEWHTYPWYTTESGYQVATSASQQHIVNAFLTNFPNIPLVIPNDAFDPYNAGKHPLDFIYYILTSKNNYGEIGIRVDHVGDPTMEGNLANNTGTYNGLNFGTAILNKSKTAIFTGEPNNNNASVTSNGTQTAYYALPAQVKKYGMMGFGNGNYSNVQSSGTFNQAMFDTIASASNAAGHKIIWTGGNAPSAMTIGQVSTVSLNWQNIGVAPTYEKWNITYQLRNSSGTTVFSSNSKFKLFLFGPSSTPTVATDTFTIPSSVSPGTYGLYAIIKDSAGYRSTPFWMYIQGRNSDGSYTLKTGISVVTATGNVPPTVFPGNSSTIVSPASSVTIVGSASDADGTIASTVWTQVSGPSTATLSGATTTTLVASNLVVGTYVFRLTATDNLGATTSADVSVSVITVSVSAGTNQVVQLPTDSTTLTGNQVGLSQPTWSQVSGPNTATIVSPNTLTTKLKGLVVGTYTFRLTMYYSTTAYTSDVSVNVLSAPAPNIPPTANAGADQSITYPSQSSVTLAGSGTDVDGYVVAYQWSQVSGPNTATISPATLPTTTASGLIVGTYKFTLVVVDNQGAASAPDTIQVTVLNAPNIPPVVNAGPDQILNPPNNTSTTLTGSATDADGYIVSYLWSTVSGGSPTIGTPSSSVTTVSNLIPGTTYKFQLVATDNNGGVGRDTVQVISVNNPTTYYIKSVTTKWNTTVSPARKYVLITWTNNTTDRIELSPGGGYITSIKQAYAIVDGGRHLTVTIKFSDNTTQYFAKKIM